MSPGALVQWLRIHLPMQGTWVWSPVQEDPTCHEATKLASHNSEVHVPREPMLCNEEPHQQEIHVLQLMRSPAHYS